MCQICVDAVKKYFPGISNKEMNDLLWGGTAFPFVEGEYIERQLAEHRSIIDGLKERPGFDLVGDVGIALMIADAETWSVMRVRDHK